MIKLQPKQQLMVILAEECGELLQACSKILRRGSVDLDDTHMPETRELYKEKLVEELGDVYCMINLLHEWDIVSWDELEERAEYKKKKLEKWSDLVCQTLNQ